jgi:hypothetical protein
MGLSYPSNLMAEHQAEGIHVHRAIQRWIETGDSGSIHAGVSWITETLPDRTKGLPLYSEVLVSDMARYASAVDLIVGDTWLDLYDFKKGAFKRPYVSKQLGIYKYFIETHPDCKVRRCYCACLRDCEYYPIVPIRTQEVEKLLYG